jgi:Rrf2 family iron-sulfur cluster assembly transcriptional regulator
LTRKPSEYTIENTLRVLDETLAPEENRCKRADACKMLPLWQEFNIVINYFFDGISLEDLVEGRIGFEG